MKPRLRAQLYYRIQIHQRYNQVIYELWFRQGHLRILLSFRLNSLSRLQIPGSLSVDYKAKYLHLKLMTFDSVEWFAMILYITIK